MKHSLYLFAFFLFTLPSFASLPSDEEKADCAVEYGTQSKGLEATLTTSCPTFEITDSGQFKVEDTKPPLTPQLAETNTAMPSIPMTGPDFLDLPSFHEVGSDFLKAQEYIRDDRKIRATKELLSELPRKMEKILREEPRLHHFNPEAGAESHELEIFCFDPLYRYQSIDESKEIVGSAPNLHTDYFPLMKYTGLKRYFMSQFPEEFQSEEYELVKTVNVWMLLSEGAGSFPLGFVSPEFLYDQVPPSRRAELAHTGDKAHYASLRLSTDPAMDSETSDEEEEDEEGEGEWQAPKTPLCRIRASDDTLPFPHGEIVDFISGGFYLAKKAGASFPIPMILNPQMKQFDVVAFDSKHIVHGPIFNKGLEQDRESMEFRCFYFKKVKKRK